MSLALFVILACGLYGAVLAGWRSPRLSAYVAIKLPVLFLGAIAIVAVFNWMTASVLGSELSFRTTVFVVLASMTIGCWILLSLVPIALFFLVSGVSYAGTHDILRRKICGKTEGKSHLSAARWNQDVVPDTRCRHAADDDVHAANARQAGKGLVDGGETILPLALRLNV